MAITPKILAVAALVALVGCRKSAKQLTATEVCQKLEASGVAARCRGSWPPAAPSPPSEKVVFDLPLPPIAVGTPRMGQVLRFESDDAFGKTEKCFTGQLAVDPEDVGRDATDAGVCLKGPHRYGSRKALIFVQADDGLSAADGQKMKSIVDGL